MDKEEILRKVDHTLLQQGATWEEIKGICEDAMTYHTASVCIPPSYVKQAKEYVDNRMKICTVIGFPNGYNTTEVKQFETINAIENGADEIDMVINLGWVKSQKFDLVENEIKIIKKTCGLKIFKVIIETCLLTEEEKIKLCEVVTSGGADYIKTSTGFSTKGATLSDIVLFTNHVGKEVKIKAAGGISSFEDGEDFSKAGADRLGTSKLIKLIKSELNH